MAAQSTRLENYLQLRLPRTWHGWQVAFWCLLRRCPKCHGLLLQDWRIYDDGQRLYCLPCGGLILPRGVWRALHWNWRSEQQETE